MESMEKESGFLHKSESKALLENILPQILHDLTRNGECTIPVNTANIINLKLFPKLQDPSQVFDYQVPVAIRDLRLLLENSGKRIDLFCCWWDAKLTVCNAYMYSGVGSCAAANRAFH